MQVLKFKKGKLPCKYLGMPLATRHNSGKLWDPLLIKINQRLSSWKGRWLSWAGRLTLIKSVLAALPIYMMSCLPLLGSINDKCSQKLRQFFLQGTSDQKKLPLISWEKVCRSREATGAGIKQLSLQNKALGGKLAWKIYEQ